MYGIAYLQISYNSLLKNYKLLILDNILIVPVASIFYERR